MKDLKCSKSTCRFNDAYCCCAKQITIGDATDCSSFTQREHNPKNTFEMAEDFEKRNYTVDTTVNCEAQECLFNEDKKCVSNGITVLSEVGHEAVCATYIER